ncbi:hypothetical protein GCM10011515_16520 [Tsuneonella deserti]|uniref:Uncharacterized protein n=1 Tax=Tsuneonella deserti TaxID=2035528 RepID=A0ABQ1SB05_9SPHN|nr:hypothetical protein GCM10011515_16520 [Tsuneonella deserti]
MRGETHLDTGLVMQSEPVDQVGAGAIVANDLDRPPGAAQALYDLSSAATPEMSQKCAEVMSIRMVCAVSG